jgi:hypothetical protein
MGLHEPSSKTKELSSMRASLLLLLAGLLALAVGPASAQDRNAKVRNDRALFESSPDWIYNDLSAGIRTARSTGKPMLVVFRCIPCEACHDFDDEVARRDPIIRDLMDKFVCVRIVQANALDLSHFQFDFDQSFAILFMNADLTIYGRFGTRSARPEQEDISLQGLRKALADALRLHQDEKARPSLAGKQVKRALFKTPLDFPTLSGRYQRELDYGGTVAQSCVHCHQVREAERRFYRERSRSIPDEILFPYPDPDVLGLRMDPREMARIVTVARNSAADRDGLLPGDHIRFLDGQPVLSVADIQWVLHGAPASGSLAAQVLRDGKPIARTISLQPGWRRGDISWRATTWDLRRMALGGMKLEAFKDAEYTRAGLRPDRMALSVVHVGEFGEHAVAKRAGFRKGDIIVSFDGLEGRMTESELLAHTIQQRAPGDTVVVTEKRDGARKTMSYVLP